MKASEEPRNGWVGLGVRVRARVRATLVGGLGWLGLLLVAVHAARAEAIFPEDLVLEGWGLGSGLGSGLGTPERPAGWG